MLSRLARLQTHAIRRLATKPPEPPITQGKRTATAIGTGIAAGLSIYIAASAVNIMMRPSSGRSK